VQGCFGARIMGAGFGGSILALIKRGAEAALEAAVERQVIVCSTADGAFARAA
jgi:galactokinase